MYSLTVCDHIMIAHSFSGAMFGPPQRVHGATFVVGAEFRAGSLDDLDLLVDIGLARAELRRILDAVDHRNLDDAAEFAGRNTIMEFMAAHIHGRVAAACRDGALGSGGRAVVSPKIVLRESPLAWAAYEAELG